MENDIKELIAKNIKIMIARMSLSQSELADKAGLNRSTVNEVVRAKKACSIETLQKIATAFLVQPRFLLRQDLDFSNLTGIKKIDKAIADINNNIYKGPVALKTISKYFAKNYKVAYVEKCLDDPDRVGPGLKEELQINSSSEQIALNRANVVRSAWITGDQVHTLTEVRQNATFGPNSPANATSNKGRFEITVLVDSWILTHGIDAIIDGSPIKIERRLLKYIEKKFQ